MEGTFAEREAAVRMSTKLRHTQRVKQKLEEKLENLKTLEDKLHSTIRNHVSKAEWKCQQMLSIDNTSEFLSQYGKVAQILEAASNTIDLLTISAEELIDDAGFEESTGDETISWSPDKPQLSSTVIQSESALHINKKTDDIDLKADTRLTDRCKIANQLHKSKSHFPVSCDTSIEQDTVLSDTVCIDTKTGHRTCDTLSENTRKISQHTGCNFAGKDASSLPSRNEELENSERSISCDVTENSDTSKAVQQNLETEPNTSTNKVPTSKVVASHGVPMCVKKSLSCGLSDAYSSAQQSDKTHSMVNSVKHSDSPKVKPSTSTRKRKSKKKGTKGGLLEGDSTQSDSSDIAKKCGSKNDEKTDATVNEVVVKQAEVRYNEFEKGLCEELNRQDANETKLSAEQLQTDEQCRKCFEGLADEINEEIDCLSSTSTNQTNSRNETNVITNAKPTDSSGLGQKSNNKTNSIKGNSGTTLDESGKNDDAFTGETSEKLSASRGLTTGSLLSGKITPVIVSEIVSPWCFFVQRNGPELNEMMEQICEYMSKTGLKEPPMLDANIGALCLARYSRDVIYYRAYIKQIYRSSDCHVSEVDVLYVDYGNREQVKTKDLRALPHTFMTLPSQAICCALAEIMPCNKYCVWAEDDVNLFRQYVTGQNLSCVTSSIRTSATTIPQIVQLSVTYPIPTLKSLPDGSYFMSQFNIADLMIQAKRARHVDLPEQIGLLVKSGEGTEEVAILGQYLETGSGSSVHITEILESNSDSVKQPTEIQSTHDDNASVKHVNTSAENVTGEQKASGDIVEKNDEDDTQRDIKKTEDSNKAETSVKTIVDTKHDSKMVNMNGDSLKSESSETESQFAEKLPDREVVGSRGQLDRIKEEITDTGLTDARSTVSSVSNDAGSLLDQESSLSDLHYDIAYLQLNPQGQEVMLSHVKTPKEFYVHVISQQCGEALDSLMKNLNSVFEKVNRRKLARLSKVFEPAINKLCCAQFQEDNNFYRGVIRCTKSDKRTLDGYILIHYIDFGDEEWLPRKRIFPLPSQFCKVPRLALRCDLVYVKPVQNKSGGPVKWSSASIKKFMEIAGLEKTLHMHVVHGSLDDFKHCDPSEDMPSLGVLLVDYTGPEEVCINIDLINEGVATLDSTPAKGKVDHHSSKETHEPDGFDTWNPMEEDFFSKRNSYNIDTDDVGVATTGYKAEDDTNICRFFSSGRTCWRGERCQYRHVQVHSGVTLDQDEVYAITDVHTEHLPAAGSWVAMEITTILSPSHFYAILPLGNKSLDKTVSKSDHSEGGCMAVTGTEETLDDLLAALSCEYNKRPSHQDSMFLKATGQMVVARYSKDLQWYRARVVAVSEEKVKVFYVDFGNTEWLSEDEIADIKPEFLHLPFQAIECFLNIEYKHNDQWCEQSKQEFREYVDGKTLIAYIKWRSWNGCIWLDLYDTTTDDDINVGAVMVEKGYAKIIDVPSDNTIDTDNMTSQSRSQSDYEVLIPG